MFKRGQAVKLLLDENHSTEGDAIEHEATFLRHHNDGEWADVELSKEHAGGKKLLSVPLSVIKAAAALIFFLLGVVPARAQFEGYVTPQSVQQTVFSVTTCTGVEQLVTIANLGQNVHFLTYAVNNGGNPTVVKARILATDTSGTFAISDTATNSSGIITANGYYITVRVGITCTSGANVSATYYGTSSDVVPQTGVGDSSAYSKVIVANQTSTGSINYSGILTPYGSTCGKIFFVFGASTSGSTLSVTSSDAGGVAGQTPLPATTLVNTNGVQVLPVPCLEAASVSVNYAAGGGANTYSIVYMFDKPGAAMGADPCASPGVLKSSAPITAPAATTTQIIAPSGATTVYVCGYQLGVVVAVTGTYQWTTGTGATCGTGTVNKSGSIPINAATPVTYGPGSTIFSGSPGQGVCITLTGAGDNAAGITTFVQQ